MRAITLVVALMLAAAGGCGTSAPNMAAPVEPLTAAQKLAYVSILIINSCVPLAPDRESEAARQEIRRAAMLKAEALKRELGPALEAAEAEWQEIDSRLDRACYFQMQGEPTSTAEVLGAANDAFAKALGL